MHPSCTYPIIEKRVFLGVGIVGFNHVPVLVTPTSNHGGIKHMATDTIIYLI